MSIALSVNLNKIALIRNSRDGEYPSVADFALRSVKAGANGLTAHPRPDQRHIRPGDITVLANTVKANPHLELNIEGNPFASALADYAGLLNITTEHKPAQCTLVPDSNTQKTSDHGFDLFKDGTQLKPIIDELKTKGIRVSLFMDPNCEQIEQAHLIGADRIELYTGPFALAYQQDKQQAEHIFKQHCIAAEYANQLGLGVNAGHDLNLNNMQLYKELPYLQEVSIGHALTVDALIMGFEKAVEAYATICH